MVIKICLSRHANSTRHSSLDNPISEDYPNLTTRGVEQAKETAQNQILPTIERAESGTVYCILAKSDQARTGETGEVYGAELEMIARERDDIVVLTRKKKLSIYQDKGGVRRTIQAVREIVQAPNKKYVVTFPLQVRELSYAYNDRWTTRDGKKTEYFAELVDKYNGSHAEAVHDWIKNQGKLKLHGRTIEGPLPKDVAQQYLVGMTRTYQFARRILPDSPLIVHGVGHQWDLDSVVASFRNEAVDYESFLETTGGVVIGESESMSIELGPTRKVSYRGKTYER